MLVNFFLLHIRIHRNYFNFLRFTVNRGLGFLIHYLYSIKVWSAAPQTTLWGGPGPRYEPGTGGSSGRNANWPPHLQTSKYLCYFCSMLYSIWLEGQEYLLLLKKGINLTKQYNVCTLLLLRIFKHWCEWICSNWIGMQIFTCRLCMLKIW